LAAASIPAGRNPIETLPAEPSIVGYEGTLRRIAGGLYCERARHKLEGRARSLFCGGIEQRQIN
jgi:hypothetical protein